MSREQISPPGAPKHEVRVDPQLDRTARLLAGIAGPESDSSGKQQAISAHFAQMNASFASYEQRVGAPMRTWSERVLSQREGATVFYPFAGPDLVTVHRFYPGASRYVLVALQQAGPPPSLDALSDRAFASTLSSYRQIFEHFDKRGFFITARMGRGFQTAGAQAPGIAGVLMAFAAREGFEVLSMEPVQIAPSGDGLLGVEPPERTAESWNSVRMMLRRPKDGSLVEVDYLMLDLSNKGLSRNESAARFFHTLSGGPVVLKAASHLPQKKPFSRIRDLMIEGASEIVQDETGVAYGTLSEHFDVRLFGRFSKVNPLFDGRAQQALRRAYQQDDTVEPLAFSIGYRKESGAALQVARRR